MTCRVYVGEYQDRITGAAATAYVVIDENGRLVKAMAQKVKTNKGLSLQAVKLAVQGLCYLHGMDEAMLCMDSPTALAALRQECPPKGSRRKITEIRYHIANDLCKTSQDSAVLDCRAIRLPQPCRMQGAFASLLRGHDSTKPVSVDDTHEGLCTVRRVRAALSRTVRGRKPADTPPRRYNAGANTKRKQ